VLSHSAPCCCFDETVDATMTSPFCGERNLVLVCILIRWVC